MRLRRHLPAVVAALLLIGCAPDQISPGAGTPAEQPTDRTTPTPTTAPTADPTSPPATSPGDPGGDRYDY